MIAANALVLQAVRELPAQVVFPIYGVGNLVGTVVLSALIWKERIPMKARLGLVPAAASIMLLGRM